MFVVTLPVSASNNPAEFSRAAALAGADVLEIRGNLTPNIPAFDSVLPILASPRHSDPTLATRLQAQYIDLELAEKETVPTNTQLIRSYHNYDHTPSDVELGVILEQMEATKPAFIKIAVQVNSAADLLRIVSWQQQYAHTKRHIILGMGWKAHWTRLQSPMCCPFTYTYLANGEQAAPGQVPLEQYTAHQLTKPAVFAILGGMQIEHSLSPLLHNTLLTTHGIDAFYTRIPVAPDEPFPNIAKLHQLGVRGLSITAPWKERSFSYANQLADSARNIGVTNTLIWNEKDITGHNTDIIGLQQGYILSKKADVCVVGTGGVVPAVLQALKSTESTVHLFGRNLTKARELATQHGATAHALSDLPNHTCETLIWAASGEPELELPKPKDDQSIAIDLRYGRITEFMSKARQVGFVTHDGLAMLLHQGLEQFKLFTGQSITADEASTMQTLLSRSAHGQ